MDYLIFREGCSEALRSLTLTLPISNTEADNNPSELPHHSRGAATPAGSSRVGSRPV